MFSGLLLKTSHSKGLVKSVACNLDHMLLRIGVLLIGTTSLHSFTLKKASFLKLFS